ncbi:metal ABC transporter solute-binding protein, Zn/Mn family [Calidifontibacillus erzurumensis]|uniref:metal ABC transporter solute-binding protein, Zn/Mn family n=1 Tax=Calidifontibacillus erzurumensis TaxID=2741433 RepID=UPI0035B54D3E
MISRTMKTIILIFLLFSTFIIGCSQKNTENIQEETNNDDKIKIFTTLYPIEYFTKKIGTSHVEVESIIPLGSNAHTFEPTTKTMIEIAEGDAFIFTSEQMERYAHKIAEALDKENVKIIEAAKDIEMIQHEDDENHNENDEEEHSHGDVDPHVWIDPILSITIAENIKNSLIDLKPEASAEFEARFNELKAQLEQLDAKFRDLVKDKTSPQIIVSHAAYGYWEKRYGIKQLAISGLSSTNEPSQKQLQKIINVAKENDIKYVIFEQNITPKVAEIIKDEINAQSLYLHNLSVLREEDIKNNEDYFSLMEENLNTLKIALK